MRKGWLVILLLASGMAHAASFDCAKAKTPLEQAVCGSPELSAADDEMAAAYKAALAKVPPAMKATVRNDQLAWVHWMEVSCKARAPLPSTEQMGLLSGFYASRTKELRSLVWRKGGVTFISRSIVLLTPVDPEHEHGALPPASETPDYGTLFASWPQSTSDTPEWKAWNKAIETAMRNVDWESEDTGKSEGGVSQKLEADPDSDEDITVSVDFDGRELVTSSISESSSTHRAPHPNESIIRFNWLLKEKRELRPEDVFLADSGWDRMIQARCVKALRRQFGADSEFFSNNDFANTLHKIIVHPRNWTFTDKGLVISFPENTIMPRVSPVNDVTIPWAVLKPLLQASFVRSSQLRFAGTQLSH